MNIKYYCCNCRFLNTHSFDEPCLSCHICSKWEPQEKKYNDHMDAMGYSRIALNSIYGSNIIKATNISIALEIINVIFNDPATIVFWNDGTKTVVKATDEAFDPEKGLAMAISKKVLGNKGNYFNEFKKWLPEETEVENELQLVP